jgi:hypothetical protein
MSGPFYLAEWHSEVTLSLAIQNSSLGMRRSWSTSKSMRRILGKLFGSLSSVRPVLTHWPAFFRSSHSVLPSVRFDTLVTRIYHTPNPASDAEKWTIESRHDGKVSIERFSHVGSSSLSRSPSSLITSWRPLLPTRSRAYWNLPSFR